PPPAAAGPHCLGVGSAHRRGRAGAVRPTRISVWLRPTGHLGTRGTTMSDNTGWEILIWVVLPYAAIAIFILGHIWRWRYDQFGWTSYSTQLQERKILKWGGPLFHYATFAAIAGHVLGILIPASWVSAIGIPDDLYHWFAAIAGNIASVLVAIGVAVLAAR